MPNVDKYCKKCNQSRLFRHLYDAAHGIPGAYMQGTERFVCGACDHTIRQGDEEAKSFVFVMPK